MKALKQFTVMSNYPIAARIHINYISVWNPNPTMPYCQTIHKNLRGSLQTLNHFQKVWHPYDAMCHSDVTGMCKKPSGRCKRTESVPAFMVWDSCGYFRQIIFKRCLWVAGSSVAHWAVTRPPACAATTAVWCPGHLQRLSNHRPFFSVNTQPFLFSSTTNTNYIANWLALCLSAIRSG